MSGVFISYRRQDSQSAAGRLADHLKENLRAPVFRDVETIEPGVDFVEAIEKALASCAVMLVVIGPRWISISDASGRRRVDDESDYTRLEVGTALKRNVRVIPVLVEGAVMPGDNEVQVNYMLAGHRMVARLQVAVDAHRMDGTITDEDTGARFPLVLYRQ